MMTLIDFEKRQETTYVCYRIKGYNMEDGH